MPRILVDGQEIEIPGGAKLNCIEAAKLAGVEIPHYCWHPGLSVAGSCRMCLIEVGMKDAKTGVVTMQPKLVPGCNTPATDGTVIVTQTEKVAQARAMVEEDLLLRHPIDCPICDKAGECRLQDYHFEHGQKERRADVQPFTSRRRDLGDVALFVDRCVMCSRCVRFTREISGTSELMIANRGAHEEINIFDGHPLENKLSGNVVDLCPVGALADKDFLYKQRVWFMRRHRGVCAGCSIGCSIWIEENQDRIYRIKPRENPHLNKWWICNDGRYDYPHVHSDKRLTQPKRREAGALIDADWTELPSRLRADLRAAGHLAAVVSPFMTVEEAYLLCKFVRSIDKKATIVVGPIPSVGKDEIFPNGFTIAAEKCPNRRGVEAVVSHFTKQSSDWGRFLQELEAGSIAGVWVSGGYREPWIDEAAAAKFEKAKTLVVQDLFNSPLADLATYLLAGAAYAEKEGSYVNRYDRLQSFKKAIRPPLGVRTEGELLWTLGERKGMYDARKVLDELAREIVYFAAAVAPIPETGLDLKVDLLAKNASPAANIC